MTTRNRIVKAMQELESVVTMKRFCYVYRPKERMFFIYSTGCQPFPFIAKTGYEESAKAATLMANKGITANDYVEARWRYKVLQEQLQIIDNAGVVSGVTRRERTK